MPPSFCSVQTWHSIARRRPEPPLASISGVTTAATAIASDELELHYQPKVSALTGELMGCEALVRWRHPQKGFIPPSDFIPHAERTGAIRSLTTWVAGTALRDLERWQEAGLEIDVSINVSPVDLAEPGFADSIAMLLDQTGAAANHVVLEVTESGAMKDLPATLRMMEQLRVLGIRFSIDDFASGESISKHHVFDRI